MYTNCDKYCYVANATFIQLLNLVDLILGVCVATFGFHLLSQLGKSLNDHQSLMFFTVGCACYGSALLILALFSFTSLVFTACKSFGYLSAYFALLVSLFSFIFASCAIGYKSSIYRYIDTNYEALGLDDNNVIFFKKVYTFISYGLYGLFLLEIFRCKITRSYLDICNRCNEHYKLLEDKEQLDLSEKQSEKQTARKEKYDNLKSFYKQKYNLTSDSVEATTLNDNDDYNDQTRV